MGFFFFFNQQRLISVLGYRFAELHPRWRQQCWSSLPHNAAHISRPLHQQHSSEKSLINAGRAEVSGSSQKAPRRPRTPCWSEVWSEPRLAPTTLAETDVFLCCVVVLNKHCHTHVHIHMYLYAHTEPACFCVLVRSALSSCGLAGFSNTHALCLRCAQRPPVVWPHTIPAHQHSFFFSPQITSLQNTYLAVALRLHFHRASIYWFYLKTMFCVCLDNHAFGNELVIRPRCAVLLSRHVNLCFPQSRLLSPSASQLSVCCVSFCSLLLEASEFTWGRWGRGGDTRPAWKHKQGPVWSQPSVTDTITPAAEAPMC